MFSVGFFPDGQILSVAVWFFSDVDFVAEYDFHISVTGVNRFFFEDCNRFVFIKLAGIILKMDFAQSKFRNFLVRKRLSDFFFQKFRILLVIRAYGN